jgi:hypothetical protein
MVTLSDWLWPTPEGLFGVLRCATARCLACLEAWSVDGRPTPLHWPAAGELVAYEAYPAEPAPAADGGHDS